MTRIFLILLIFSVFFSCKKIDYPGQQPGTNNIDIYVAGNIGERHTPFLIKNGEFIPIQLGNIPLDQVELRHFEINNKKAYALFRYSEPQYEQVLGFYTIDNQIKHIKTPFYHSLMAVDKNNVYLLLDHNNLLKNGQHYKQYPDLVGASQLVINNSNIYVRYFQEKFYLKNGQKIPLVYNGLYSNVKDLYVYKDDVYIAGYYENNNYERVTGYWKNGMFNEVPTGFSLAFFCGIGVDKNNIYIVSFDTDVPSPLSMVSLYKNGIPEPFSPLRSFADFRGVKFYNGDMYTLLTIYGQNDLVALVYKNSTLIAEYPINDFYYYQDFILEIAPKQ